MKDVRILCLGAAVQDVFLQGKIFAAHKDGKDYVQEFELGSKNEVEYVTISVGGGATNAAVTFARQGLHAMYMGRLGQDEPGRIVLNMLHNEDVDTSLIKYAQKEGTGYSAILLAPNGERTVLTYRGASKHYELAEKDFHDTHVDWLYISSLSGDIAALKTAIAYAASRKIKIAINPGNGELEHLKQLREVLGKFTILSLNREEMAGLFEGKTTQEIMRRASQHVSTVLMTDGPNGSFATDGTHLFSAGMYEDVKVVDRLGAGDAFTSGFVCKIAEGQSIEQALTFASANSTSVVAQIGAKTGILKQNASLHSMPIEVSNL
jgi:sugar/nucleoside kinase (ribokinase family)